MNTLATVPLPALAVSQQRERRRERGMTDGDYTKDEAMAFQTFSGRLKCEEADQYDGKEAPTCLPLCEACMLKWLEMNP